jgi:hypothetical protein
MAKEKSLVEEAIIQMKNLEEAVAENAKGILASTMSQEIKELVKESLFEQESDDEVEDDAVVDMDNMDIGADNQDTDMEDDDMEDDMADDDMEDDMADDDMEDDMADDDMEDDMADDDMEEPIDLTKKSDEEVLRVFQLMGPDDNIVVTKDAGGNINLKDTQSNKEYMIVGEGMDDMYGDDEDEEEEYDEFSESHSNIDDIVEKVFGEDDMEDDMEDEFMEEDDMEDDMEGDMTTGDVNTDLTSEDDIVYEIEFDEDEEDMEDDEFMENNMYESKSGKKTIKPKGVGMGKPNVKVYSKNPNQGTGFKTKMKQGPRAVGTGKAKFEYKAGENLGDKLGKNKMVKKAETKEGVRTLGAGSRAGRKGGLPKPRAHSAFNMALKENDTREVQVLREKNEEYRKALNIFRNKLTEVAVFNSNLAYATRLFTEHSTSKQEKINILRRFDGVESIKESKGLYKTIKDELSPTTSQSMNESFERKIENTPTTGSAINLIENKTYENPQFLRMKDLMSKMK